MNRYICIHGHFYQPPRENPWFEEVELQDSAHPYHDWNERITAECYAPNAASRIMGSDKKVSRMVNNYASMSFNFGPTLLSWMERHAPEDYQNILAADKESQARFSGHGSAIAQVYNHMIMPLANARDERTQVPGGSGILNTVSAASPKGCGSPRPRSIPGRWKSSPNTASDLPSSPRTRPPKYARSAMRNGRP